MIKELLKDFFKEKINILYVSLLIISVLSYQSIESLGISKVLSKLYKSFEENNISEINKWTIYFIIIYSIVIGFYILKDVSYILFNPKFYEFITNKLYNRIVLSYQKNFENLDIGNITSKYSIIPWSFKNLIYFIVVNILPDISSLSIILLYIFTVNKFIFTTMFIGIIIILIITKYSYKNLLIVQNNFVNQQHKSNSIFFEKINNLFPIYINNSIKTELQNIDNSEKNYIKNEKRGLLENNKLSFKIIIVNIIVYCILNGYIIKINNQNKSEILIFYLSLFGFYFKHTLTFGHEMAYLLLQYSGIKSQAKFLNQLFKNQELGIEKVNIQNIKFNGVSFKYPNTDNLIIDNLNLNINIGDKIVIFGKSGSGKSTIFKLLMGFFSPIKGEILVNNENINNLELSFYRNQFAYVTQDTKLFDMTVIENIKYSINVTNEDVYNLISKYNINPVYEKLEKGLETNAGTDGNNLSGGQKQMVLILRALLKKPKIYLFDEPTSALDPDTRNIIYNILKDIKETTLIISHDPKIKDYISIVYNLTDKQLVKESK